MAMATTLKSDGLPKPPTSKTIRERLEHWREVLLQVQSGVDTQTSVGTAWISLDRWLDEWVDQMGEGRSADVWDREWPATWRRDRMSKGA
jgi:hypothetical protein